MRLADLPLVGEMSGRTEGGEPHVPALTTSPTAARPEPPHPTGINTTLAVPTIFAVNPANRSAASRFTCQ